MPTATIILDWRSRNTTNQHSLKYVIKPDSIYPGTPFTVSIYDPEPYLLFSVYGGLSDKTVANEVESKNELIQVTANTEFPIAKLAGVVASTPIIKGDNRTIFQAGGSDLKPFLPVINSQLKPDFPFSKVYGSVRAVYDTYKAQVWEHAGIDAAGEIVLFAQNANSLEFTDIPITISDPTQNSAAAGDSVQIIPVEVTRGYWGIHGAVFSFLVFPENATVMATLGKVEKQSVNATASIKSQSVTLDGSGFAAIATPIKELTNAAGAFTDKDKKPVSNAYITKATGGIAYTKGVYGTAYIDYEIEGRRWDYFPQVVESLGGGITQTNGSVIAKYKESETKYDVPATTFGFIDEVEVITVYFETAVTSDGTYELPPNLSSGDRTYPSTSFPAGSLMPKNGHSVGEEAIEVAKFDGFTLSTYINESRKLPFLPFGGSSNPDRKYQLKKTVPDWVKNSDIEQINALEVELKQKYRIA